MTDHKAYAAEVAAGLGMHLDRTWGNPGSARIADGLEHSPEARREYYLHWRKGRIEAYPGYPKTNRSFPGTRPGITVDPKRGPSVVAAEIQRRLEPRYLEILKAVVAYNLEEEIQTGTRQVFAADVVRVFEGTGTPVSLPSHGQSDYQTELIVGGPGPLGGHVKAIGDGTRVQFDRFDVPASVALAMLRCYASWRAE